MSNTLGSLRKYLPTLKNREGSTTSSPTSDVPVEENLDEKTGKLDSDSDVDVASKEVTTAVDPDLNPGGLSFEEGERALYASLGDQPSPSGHQFRSQLHYVSFTCGRRGLWCVDGEGASQRVLCSQHCPWLGSLPGSMRSALSHGTGTRSLCGALSPESSSGSLSRTQRQ